MRQGTSWETNSSWISQEAQTAKELKITPILDKLLEYKRSWIQHVNRIPRNRLLRVMKHYSPTGRRNHGRPLKRLLDTWDRNGSTSGPTTWKIWWWWWWWWSVKKNSPHFMEPKSSLHFPQQFATGPYLQPHYTIHSVPIYLKSILILSSQLLLGLPSQALYAFPLSHITLSSVSTSTDELGPTKVFWLSRGKDSFQWLSKNFLRMSHFQID